MNTRLVVALLAAAPLLHARASAQHAQESVTLPSIDRAELDARLVAWRALHGHAWSAEPGSIDGFATFVWGGAIDAPERPRSDADWFELALERTHDAQLLLGVRPGTLVGERALLLPLEKIGSCDKVAVRLTQVVDELPVRGASVNALFDVGGRLLSLQSTALPLIERAPKAGAVTAQAARSIAVAAFRGEHGLETHVRATGVEIVAARRGDVRIALRTHRIAVERLVDGEAPRALAYWIDASSGEIVDRRSLVDAFDVGGTLLSYATPGTLPDNPNNLSVQRPVPNAVISANAPGPVSVVTDAQGQFNFPGVASVTNLQVGYSGPFGVVTNGNGTPHTLALANLAGQGNVLVMNQPGGNPPLPGSSVTSQANCFLVANAMREWIRAINPLDATADFPVAITANSISQSCQGGMYSLNGPKIVLFRPSSFFYCYDGAYSTMIAHEYGHWLSDLYTSGNGLGMREGTADVFAQYLFDTPSFAEDYRGIGDGAVRSGLDNEQFCSPPGCKNDNYVEGLVWAGAAWKTRRNLNQSLGNVMGDLVADSLFLGWMNAYDQGTIEPVVQRQWLVLDDDDANPCNGTPHDQDIRDAFEEQGFPVAPLPIFCTSIDIIAAPGDGGDEVGPYLVQASVPPPPGSTLAAVTLRYRVDGGSFANLAMSQISTSTWQASIPGQSSPALVEWYVLAQDPAGASVVWPEASPNALEAFRVGVFAPIFWDDFEFDRGWTVVDESVVAGSWERVDPLGTTLQPEDDAGAGTRCFVTQNDSPVGGEEAHEVKGGPTRLISPRMDFRGGAPHFECSFWLANPDGDDALEVDISYDDGANWLPVRAIHRGDSPHWERLTFEHFNPTQPANQVRVRFSVADEPDDSLLECAIDEFVARSFLATSACPAPVRYCTGLPNTTGLGGAIDSSGTTSVGANDFVLTASQLPPNKPGVFFYGAQPKETPFGDGRLCVKSPVVRLGPVLQTSATGDASRPIDFTSPPNPAAQITPGATWCFQLWYRDPAVGLAGVNLTDGLSVTFCP